MRRKDREVTDVGRISSIISNCDCCRIGLYDEGKIYIVPLSFGFTEESGRFSFYFHGAREGRKIDLICRNPCAGFELDTNYRLNEAESACGHSARYQSVIGTGVIRFVEGAAEKRAALLKIMEQNTGNTKWEFPEKMLERTCVFRLDAEELTCKEHL